MIRRRFVMLFAFVAAMAVSFAAGVWAQAKTVVWHWPDSLEALHADPGEHKLLFEDSHVRLLEVIVQPGQKGPLHGHEYPSIFAYDAPQPKNVDYIQEDNSTRARGRVYEDQDWSTPQCRALGIQSPHQIADMDTFPEHFYRLEFKHMDGKAIESMTHYDFQK